MQATFFTRSILTVSALTLVGMFAAPAGSHAAVPSVVLDNGNAASLPNSIPGPTPKFGSVNVTVDGYGSFGANPFGPPVPLNGLPQLAVYQDIASAGSMTFASGVAIGIAGNPTRQFLTAGSIGGSGPAGSPAVIGSGGGFGGNSLSAASTFTQAGLSFTLSQSLTPFQNLSVGVVGSQLQQKYTIVNTTGSTISFDLFRYLDQDIVINSGTGLNNGGGRIVTTINDPKLHEFLFATQTATGGPNTQNVFEAITAEGGVIPTSGRYSLVSVTGTDTPLGTGIVSGAALGNSIAGDGNADQWVDAGPGFDVAVALRNSFTLAPGQSAEYITGTYFGSGSPSQIGLALVPETSTVVSCAVLVGLAGWTFLRSKKQSATQA